MNGETGTTDLNRNEVVQPAANAEETTENREEAKSSLEPPFEGTADMIMRRAEQRGDFDKYEDKEKDEHSQDEAPDKSDDEDGQKDELEA